jgi:hypothetical protein
MGCGKRGNERGSERNNERGSKRGRGGDDGGRYDACRAERRDDTREPSHPGLL